MYIIEVFEKKRWNQIKHSLSYTKDFLEEEVKELNKLVSKELLLTLPVKEKYRLIKIKASEGRAIQQELEEKRKIKEGESQGP